MEDMLLSGKEIITTSQWYEIKCRKMKSHPVYISEFREVAKVQHQKTSAAYEKVIREIFEEIDSHQIEMPFIAIPSNFDANYTVFKEADWYQALKSRYIKGES